MNDSNKRLIGNATLAVSTQILAKGGSITSMTGTLIGGGKSPSQDLVNKALGTQGIPHPDLLTNAKAVAEYLGFLRYSTSSEKKQLTS